MKKLNQLFILLLLTVSLFAQNDRKIPQLGKDNIADVIAAMTPEEKVYLLMGLGDENWTNSPSGEKTVIVPGSAGRTWAIPRLGIPPTVVSDGPAGLRIDAHPAGSSQSFFVRLFLLPQLSHRHGIQNW